MAGRFEDYPFAKKAQVVCGAACVVVGVAALWACCGSTLWWLQAQFALNEASFFVSLAALAAFVVYLAWAVHAGRFDRALYAKRVGAMHRVRRGRRIAGVCGGLAEYYEVGVVTVRIIALLLFLIMPFLAMLAYALLVFALPVE